MRKLLILGYGMGTMIVLGSMIRWAIMYNDLSQGLLGFAVGCVVLAGTWIYDLIVNIDEKVESWFNKLEAIDKRVDDIVSWMTKKEWGFKE